MGRTPQGGVTWKSLPKLGWALEEASHRNAWGLRSPWRSCSSHAGSPHRGWRLPPLKAVGSNWK